MPSDKINQYNKIFEPGIGREKTGKTTQLATTMIVVAISQGRNMLRPSNSPGTSWVGVGDFVSMATGVSREPLAP
jgi:hypothetical protein